MRSFIGGCGMTLILIICVLSMEPLWCGVTEITTQSVEARQDDLQQLYQTVSYLERRVDRLQEDNSTLYQWAKACEKRVIAGEKRADMVEKRLRKLEGRLYGGDE